MRSTIQGAVLAGMLLGAPASCSEPVHPEPGRPTAPVPTPQDAVVRVEAGPDLFVALPANSIVLQAARYDALRTASNVSWKKVSGPASYRLVTSDSYRAEVAGLEKGTYEFEIAVTDPSGLTDKDTIAVHVLDGARVREVGFTGLSWTCPMGCSVSVQNFRQSVPDGALIRVLLSQPGAGEWVEVRAVWGGQYVYDVSNANLVVYADDAGGQADVRVAWVVP